MTDTGAIYGDRYELRTQIGRGGTAQVYLAHDLRLDRPVALKILMAEYSHDASFVERFRREAQAAANLSHPNIVPVFDWGETEHTYYIVMEYVDGEPLSSIIRTQAPLAPTHAASIGADIAAALAYAHRHQMVHRDVKPGNVLITEDGLVKVTDFGIARAIGVDDQVTQTGLVMGTASYFSPEQAQGLDVDGRSDVYSLGVVLFEMVTGRAPFTGDNPVSIAYQHVREEAPTPRSINPQVPEELEAIICKAMAKSVDARYATADELRADLDRFLRGQPVIAGAAPATIAMQRADTTMMSAIKIDDPQTSGVAYRRSTTGWWVAAAIVLLVAIGLAAFFGGRELGWFKTAKPKVAIPAVVGKTKANAVNTLHAKGFKTSIQPVAGTIKNKGHVIGQDPSAGQKVDKGSVVTLDVAGTPPKVGVPTVTTLQAKDAEAQLKTSGFKWKVTDVKGTPAQKGTVVAQNPAGGGQAPKGSTITLSVVNGTTMVAVPNVTGYTQEQAGAALNTAQLQGGQTINTLSLTVPPGDIVRTNPPQGTMVPVGTSVKLYISEGEVNVPDVSTANPPLAQAENSLTQVGLRYQISSSSQPAPNQSLEGAVYGQFPAADKSVVPGRIITLYVYGPTNATTTTTLPIGNTGTTPPPTP